MTFVYLCPVGLSFLLLGAHYMHADNAAMVAVTLALLAMLALRKRWVPYVLQVALALATLEWLRTLVLLVQERAALGQPWLRLALILGGVAVLSALSILVFRSRQVRSRFETPDNRAP